MGEPEQVAQFELQATQVFPVKKLPSTQEMQALALLDEEHDLQDEWQVKTGEGAGVAQRLAMVSDNPVGQVKQVDPVEQVAQLELQDKHYPLLKYFPEAHEVHAFALFPAEQSLQELWQSYSHVVPDAANRYPVAQEVQ